MAVDLLALAAGLIALCVGTEIAVRGAVAIARIFRLSPILIGLTLVAFGTDLPELFVAIRGAFEIIAGRDASGIIVGNAVGSSICQISLVTGLVALMMPGQKLKRRLRTLAFPLLGAVVLLVLAGMNGEVRWREGSLLVAAFAGYLGVSFLRRKIDDGDSDSETEEENENDSPSAKSPLWIGLTFLIAGLAIVVFSSEFVLEKALFIADSWNVDQSFVGAVIVAVGTSLPELAISFGAAIRKQPGLSIGNVVGSNIFDCLVPIGVAGIISGVKMDRGILVFDLPVFADLVRALSVFPPERSPAQPVGRVGVMCRVFRLCGSAVFSGTIIVSLKETDPTLSVRKATLLDRGPDPVGLQT